MAHSVNAAATARMSQVQNDTVEQLPKGKEADEEDGGQMKIEIQDDETITLDAVKYVRVGEPSECEKDVVATTTPLIDADGRYLTEPETRTGFYVLHASGEIYRDWQNIGRRRPNGNIFVTREAAIREAAVRAACQRIRKWKAENVPFVEDWSDKKQLKYFGCYNRTLNKFAVDSCVSRQPVGVPVFFDSAYDIERCLRECESDWRIIAGLDAEEAE